MIAIVSSDRRESSALAALCEINGWTANTCDSARAFRRSLTSAIPRVVVARQKFSDGYSDDVFAALRGIDGVRVIIVASASAASSEEARQLSLGADCVLRDPVRPEVLAGYLAKYHAENSRRAATRGRAAPKPLALAGAELDPVLRRLQRGRRNAQLTPREVALAQALATAQGHVITYDELYEQILGRKFRGDTSNMRVLLGKLCASASSIGVALRPCVEVIAKTGYRYSPRPRRHRHAQRTRGRPS